MFLDEEVDLPILSKIPSRAFENIKCPVCLTNIRMAASRSWLYLHKCVLHELLVSQFIMNFRQSLNFEIGLPPDIK